MSVIEGVEPEFAPSTPLYNPALYTILYNMSIKLVVEILRAVTWSMLIIVGR